jgi:hypothetical protein
MRESFVKVHLHSLVVCARLEKVGFNVGGWNIGV